MECLEHTAASITQLEMEDIKMNTIEQAREHAESLRVVMQDQAATIIEDLCDAIDALLAELAALKGQEHVGRIASNGYPELYKPNSLPAWTLLYLAAGAQPAQKQNECWCAPGLSPRNKRAARIR